LRPVSAAAGGNVGERCLIVIGELPSVVAHGERFDGKKMLSVLDVDDGVSIGWELLSGMGS
jgi:hypothetical protein